MNEARSGVVAVLFDHHLIWPAPAAGAGTIDPAAWAQTVSVARTAVNADGQTVLTKDPDPQTYSNYYVTMAVSHPAHAERRQVVRVRGMPSVSGSADQAS